MIKFTAFFLTLLLLSTSGLAMEHSITLLIDEKVEVSGNEVLLGDIAKITADRQSRKILKSFKLGKAPAPGNFRTLKRERIELFLLRHGWKNISLLAPESIQVWRKWHLLSSDEIAFEVKKKILESMPWPKDMAVVDVPVSKEAIKIPDGKPVFSVEFPRNFNFLGSELVRLHVSAGEGKVKTLWVKSNIKIYSDIVLASRPILRNEILKEEDLYIEKRLVSSVQKGIFNNAQEIAGMRAKRAVKKGAVIFDRDIVMPAVVRRGNILNIIAMKGPLTVSTKGKALEKGFIGRIMRVENISSKKVVLAEVVDSRTVKINF